MRDHGRDDSFSWAFEGSSGNTSSQPLPAGFTARLRSQIFQSLYYRNMVHKVRNVWDLEGLIAWAQSFPVKVFEEPKVESLVDEILNHADHAGSSVLPEKCWQRI